MLPETDDLTGVCGQRVRLAGDLCGDYVVVEERANGALLIAPAPGAEGSTRRRRRPHWPGDRRRAERNSDTVSELLRAWEVQLGPQEAILEFFSAELNGQRGFLALTGVRLIFIAGTARGPDAVLSVHRGLIQTADLSGSLISARLLIRARGGTEARLQGADRAQLSRLHEHLTQM